MKSVFVLYIFYLMLSSAQAQVNNKSLQALDYAIDYVNLLTSYSGGVPIYSQTLYLEISSMPDTTIGLRHYNGVVSTKFDPCKFQKPVQFFKFLKVDIQEVNIVTYAFTVSFYATSTTVDNNGCNSVYYKLMHCRIVMLERSSGWSVFEFNLQNESD